MNSKEWAEYRAITNENMGFDEQYDTEEERINTEMNETPYINEINEIESTKNGKNSSYQRSRTNHAGMTELNKNDADVNTVPSRTKQQQQFNTPY